MSPQGFANSSPHKTYHPHGYSLPSHNVPPPQLTMNINMNMFPNVMNINMGNIPPMQSYNNIPQTPTTQQAYTQQSTKQFQYNDFFTNNITPPPQGNNGITL